MNKAGKPQWQLHEWYRGCVIQHRPGMKRRGWASTYRNLYADDQHIGTFIHHSVEAARKHIDKLHERADVSITPDEWLAYQQPAPKPPPRGDTTQAARQRRRTERLTQAARASGFETIDQLAGTLLAGTHQVVEVK